MITPFQKSIYYIHDNGGRPFKIVVRGGKVSVYARNDDDIMADSYNLTPLVKFNAAKTFVGKSVRNVMTEFGNGFGDQFKGNTLLLLLKDADVNPGAKPKYVFIGESIFSFTTRKPIQSYYSPVGNNDSPYPFAIDTDKNIYLLWNKVIMLGSKYGSLDVNSFNGDPSSLYIDITLNNNLFDVKIDNEVYFLRYSPYPMREYKRLTENGTLPIISLDKKRKNENKLIQLDEFVTKNKRFGRQMGFRAMSAIKVIQKRL